MSKTVKCFWEKKRKEKKKEEEPDGSSSFKCMAENDYSPGSMAPVGQTPAQVPQSRQMFGSML